MRFLLSGSPVVVMDLELVFDATLNICMAFESPPLSQHLLISLGTYSVRLMNNAMTHFAAGFCCGFVGTSCIPY